jgi:hypothetical protein
MTRVQRGLSSRFLPCGCLAGIYETYNGKVIAIVDARSATCADPAHAIGRSIAVPDGHQPVAPPPRSHE